MKLTTELRSQVVEIDGKDYTLRELTGSERDAYELSLVSFDKDGKPSIDDSPDVKARMIHMALRNGNDEPAFPVETINGWPSRVTRSLADAITELSGMDEDAVDVAAKD